MMRGPTRLVSDMGINSEQIQRECSKRAKQWCVYRDVFSPEVNLLCYTNSHKDILGFSTYRNKVVTPPALHLFSCLYLYKNKVVTPPHLPLYLPSCLYLYRNKVVIPPDLLSLPPLKRLLIYEQSSYSSISPSPLAPTYIGTK